MKPTGRLSTSEPAIQNVPVRTALGREIREHFLAKFGYQFVPVNFNQIELQLIDLLKKGPQR